MSTAAVSAVAAIVAPAATFAPFTFTDAATMVAAAILGDDRQAGGSFALNGMGRQTPPAGYWVSYAGYEETYKASEMHPAAFLEVLNRYAARLKADGAEAPDVIGVWFNKDADTFVLDRSRWFADRNAALVMGRGNFQKAIWDIAAGDTIEVQPLTLAV